MLEAIVLEAILTALYLAYILAIVNVAMIIVDMTYRAIRSLFNRKGNVSRAYNRHGFVNTYYRS